MRIGNQLLRYGILRVIHTNGQQMHTRTECIGEVVFLSHTDVVRGSHLLSIHINRGGFCTLQHQSNGFIFPFFWDGHILLIPCLSHKRESTRQMGGLIKVFQFPTTPIGVGGSWQGHHVSKRIRRFHGRMLIQTELPCAIQFDDICVNRLCRKTQAKEKGKKKVFHK